MLRKVRKKMRCTPIDSDEDRPFKDLSDAELFRLMMMHQRTKSSAFDRGPWRELANRIVEQQGYVITKRCRNEASDVVQASYLTCVRKAEDYWTREEVLGRLVRRSVDAAIHRVIRTRGAVEMVDMPDEASQSPADFYEKKELMELINALVKELPEIQRQCFVLRYVEGLRDVTIQQKLQLSSREAVHKHLRRACKILREGLQARGYGMPVGGMAFLLLNYSLCEAGEGRMSRLIDATPYVLNSEPIPEGLVTPLAQSLFAEGEKSEILGLIKSWGLGCALAVSIPVMGWIVWGGYNQQEKQKPAPQNKPVEEVAGVNGPAVAVQNVAEAKTPERKVQPGGFPDDPKAGEIHTLQVPQFGISLDFCWSPGNGKVSGVWVGRTEITQAQWRPIGTLLGNGSPSWFDGDDLPVEQINPPDAIGYCEKFSEISGVEVRLPTVAEWVAAASAGIKRPDRTPDAASLEESAWYEANSDGKTHPVGTKAPNALNLHDIFGNVFELAVAGPERFEICGASWSYEAKWCRPNYRGTFGAALESSSGIGFRVVHQPKGEDASK